MCLILALDMFRHEFVSMNSAVYFFSKKFISVYNSFNFRKFLQTMPLHRICFETNLYPQLLVIHLLAFINIRLHLFITFMSVSYLPLVCFFSTLRTQYANAFLTVMLFISILSTWSFVHCIECSHRFGTINLHFVFHMRSFSAFSIAFEGLLVFSNASIEGEQGNSSHPKALNTK